MNYRNVHRYNITQEFSKCSPQQAFPRNLFEMQILGPILYVPNEKLRGVAQQSVLTNPPGNADTQSSLQPTALTQCSVKGDQSCPSHFGGRNF